MTATAARDPRAGLWITDPAQAGEFFAWAEDLLSPRYGAGSRAMAASLLLNSHTRPVPCIYGIEEARRIVQHAADPRRTPNHWFDNPHNRQMLWGAVENIADKHGLTKNIWLKLWETVLQSGRSFLQYFGSMSDVLIEFENALTGNTKPQEESEMTTTPQPPPVPTYRFLDTFEIKVHAFTPVGYAVEFTGRVEVEIDPVEPGDPMLAAVQAAKLMARTVADRGFLAVSASAPVQPITAPQPPQAPQKPALLPKPQAAPQGRPGVNPPSWDKENLQLVKGDQYTDPLLGIIRVLDRKGDSVIELYTRRRDGAISKYPTVKGRGERDLTLITEALGFDVIDLKAGELSPVPAGSTMTWEVGEPNEKGFYKNLRALYIADS